jgi:hypothetical protein
MQTFDVQLNRHAIDGPHGVMHRTVEGCEPNDYLVLSCMKGTPQGRAIIETWLQNDPIMSVSIYVALADATKAVHLAHYTEGTLVDPWGHAFGDTLRQIQAAMLVAWEEILTATYRVIAKFNPDWARRRCKDMDVSLQKLLTSSDMTALKASVHPHSAIFETGFFRSRIEVHYPKYCSELSQGKLVGAFVVIQMIVQRRRDKAQYVTILLRALNMAALIAQPSRKQWQNLLMDILTDKVDTNPHKTGVQTSGKRTRAAFTGQEVTPRQDEEMLQTAMQQANEQDDHSNALQHPTHHIYAGTSDTQNDRLLPHTIQTPALQQHHTPPHLPQIRGGHRHTTCQQHAATGLDDTLPPPHTFLTAQVHKPRTADDIRLALLNLGLDVTNQEKIHLSQYQTRLRHKPTHTTKGIMNACVDQQPYPVHLLSTSYIDSAWGLFTAVKYLHTNKDIAKCIITAHAISWTSIQTYNHIRIQAREGQVLNFQPNCFNIFTEDCLLRAFRTVAREANGVITKCNPTGQTLQQNQTSRVRPSPYCNL